jgi:multidrug efflux pump subunit AcrB
MIFALLVSQIECFLILPAHLRHSFHAMHHEKLHPARLFLENSFNTFKDFYFRPIVTATLEYRWTVVAVLIAIFMLNIGLFAGGRINFTFFPSPEGTILMTNVKFVAGTSPDRVDSFLKTVEHELYETQKEFKQNLIKAATVRHGMSIGAESSGSQQGEQFGSLLVELISPDKRSVRNHQFIQRWQSKIQAVAGVETFTITERRGGPPGRDIEIRLNGEDLKKVKAAALEVAAKLKTYPGVSAIEDDMPFGQEEWLYSLTPQAEAMGLTVESVGQQLRAAYDGQLVQIFQDGDDEVEVRVVLPNTERYNLSKLEHFTFQLPNDDSLPLSSALIVKTQRGFQALRHAQWRLAVQVGADVATAQNNANNILSDLQREFLPDLMQRYGISYSLEGRSADQRDTMRDMQQGLLIGLLLIFIVLAWEFSSYVWPLIVMIAIPFGLIGAIFGHWLLGIDVTLLSLFGFFGLSGIVVNDSIVLVSFYREQREQGIPVRISLIEASCQRLRAVLMTSLTTIFGLLPMIFETSLQAQFLIPMAVAISFGLMFSTLLVLLAIPALLAIYEGIDNPATDNAAKI